MTDAVVVACLGFFGTVVTTIGVMAIKRRYDLADRRETARENSEHRCDRIEVAYGQLKTWIEERRAGWKSLAEMVDDDPDYVLRRLKELAADPDPIASLDKYIEGK